jgi:membrane protein implicated in regulation of membrane protease activity
VNLFLPDPIELFPEQLEGTVDVVITSIQSGRVKFRNSYWPAKFYQPSHPSTAFPEEAVVVVGRQGITLLVIPA